MRDYGPVKRLRPVSPHSTTVTLSSKLTFPTSGTYYNRYSGPREIVTQACIFKLLARLDPNLQADVDFVRSLRRQLLDPWQETKSATQFPAHKKVLSLLQNKKID